MLTIYIPVGVLDSHAFCPSTEPETMCCAARWRRGGVGTEVDLLEFLVCFLQEEQIKPRTNKTELRTDTTKEAARKTRRVTTQRVPLVSDHVRM